MGPEHRIPFNRPLLAGPELEYVSEAVGHGHLSGNGPFAGRCEAWLEEHTGCARALMTPSCTAALEMAIILAGVGPGDEVIMPSFTFVSTANAVVLRGGVPVFVDVREDTLNLDERQVEAAVTPRTRAIIVVHYAGVGAEMDALAEIAERRGLMLIEDAAHAIMSRYRDRPLGSLGHVGAMSFHETKNLHCGEGGALLINDEALVARAEILQEKGTDRSRFFRGQVDKYTWQDVGSSYVLSDLSCAFLWAQLEAAGRLIGRRREIWAAYDAAFAELEARGLARRPHVPAWCEHNGHLYYLLLDGPEQRARLIAFLADRGVHVVFHYVPLHTSPAGARFGRPASAGLPVTERVAERLVRLPLWSGLTDAMVQRVIAAVHAFDPVGRPAPRVAGTRA